MTEDGREMKQGSEGRRRGQPKRKDEKMKLLKGEWRRTEERKKRQRKLKKKRMLRERTEKDERQTK